MGLIRQMVAERKKAGAYHTIVVLWDAVVPAVITCLFLYAKVLLICEDSVNDAHIMNWCSCWGYMGQRMCTMAALVQLTVRARSCTFTTSLAKKCHRIKMVWPFVESPLQITLTFPLPFIVFELQTQRKTSSNTLAFHKRLAIPTLVGIVHLGDASSVPITAVIILLTTKHLI